jgi:shikimate dehydrogenase
MTQLVGLIGWPLGHSLSPAMHNSAFQALGLDWRYDPLPVTPERLAETVHGLRDHGYRGVNVTIPHKQAVIPLLDKLSDAARAIGAVNTIVIQDHSPGPSSGSPAAHEVAAQVSGRGQEVGLYGDNTDWLGFLYPLEEQGFDLAGKNALLLGAGGSARAVVYALAVRGIAHIAIWNRNPQHATRLAQHASALFPSLTVSHESLSIDDWQLTIHSSYHLIVNTTPLGMWPIVDASPWPAELPFPSGALVYDLVYRPQRTLFLRQAEQAGCALQGGLEMLVAQGAIAFELWTGHKPPVEVMLAAARDSLNGP